MIVKARTGYFAPKPPPVRPVLEFTAMDSLNAYLDIARDDLVVFEDGVEQKIETFQEATAPVSMVLVLDSSGSMKRASEQVVAAAATLRRGAAAGRQPRPADVRRQGRRGSRDYDEPAEHASKRSRSTRPRAAPRSTTRSATRS